MAVQEVKLKFVALAKVGTADRYYTGPLSWKAAARMTSWMIGCILVGELLSEESCL